jgi:outer membrane protein assembly factor BamB/beta-lactamase superfamily II metal-dependent hydrolase
MIVPNKYSALLVAGIIALGIGTTLSEASSEMRIYAIDVGQGSSELVIGPNNTTILIDGGRTGAGPTLKSYLDTIPALGDHVIDYVIASHDDGDHYEGLNYILDNGYSATTIYHCGGDHSGFGRGVAITVGSSVDLGNGANILCVVANGHLINGATFSPSVDNNQSIGLLIKYGGFHYLTAGDLQGDYDGEGEGPLGDVLRTYPSGSPLLSAQGIDVLHVNHHGSRFSTTAGYLNNLKPEVAVINNGLPYMDYGHPHKDAIDRLLARTTYTCGCCDTYQQSTGVTVPAVAGIYQTAEGDTSDCRVSTDGTVAGNIVITYDGSSAYYYVNGTPFPVDEGTTPTPTPTLTLTPTRTPTATPTSTPTTTRTPTTTPTTSLIPTQTPTLTPTRTPTATPTGPTPTVTPMASWPMFRKDAQRTGKSSAEGPLSPALKWSYAGGDKISSSPALSSAGTLYVGAEDNRLYSINSAGSLLWSYTAAEPIFSSPAVSADAVWVGSDDNRLYCTVDLTGALAWSYESGGNLSSSPAVSGTDTVYVGSEDNRFYSLNSVGSLRWSYVTSGLILSSPAISTDTGTDTVYVGSDDNRLYCMVDPTGRLSWSYITGNNISSSPALSGSDTVYVGSEDNRLYSLKSVGSLLWSYTASGPILSSPAVNAGTVYVGASDNRLYSINSGGALSWSYTTGDDISASPAVDGAGKVYVASGDGAVYSIAADGVLQWSYACEAWGTSVALGAGTVYVGSHDNMLYALAERDVLSISLDVPSWGIGSIGIGSVRESVVITASNDGNVNEDFKINGADGAGGWTIQPEIGADKFTVKADTDPYEGYDIQLGTIPTILAPAISVSGTVQFKLQYSAPSSDTKGGGIDQGFTITVTASKAI